MHRTTKLIATLMFFMAAAAQTEQYAQADGKNRISKRQKVDRRSGKPNRGGRKKTTGSGSLRGDALGTGNSLKHRKSDPRDKQRSNRSKSSRTRGNRQTAFDRKQSLPSNMATSQRPSNESGITLKRGYINNTDLYEFQRRAGSDTSTRKPFAPIDNVDKLKADEKTELESTSGFRTLSPSTTPSRKMTGPFKVGELVELLLSRADQR